MKSRYRCWRVGRGHIRGRIRGFPGSDHDRKSARDATMRVSIQIPVRIPRIEYIQTDQISSLPLKKSLQVSKRRRLDSKLRHRSNETYPGDE